MTDVIARLLARRDDSAGCWLFNGYVRPDGYAVISTIRDGRAAAMYVHRVAYEHFVGPIPEGLHLDHLCRVRHCFNPDHLEPVPPRVNTLRGVAVTAHNAAKTHCKHGHEFSPENTHIRPGGGRACRECGRTKNRRQSAARRAAA